ncbi:MAG: DUF983 domain-containing protein [Anaerolineae bacterium]|nr:DUF983 domain-containing protein [Anaerolineae bacterium]
MNKALSYRLHVFWTVFRLRCPNCGQGRIFTGLFAMNKTCPYCGVRFERESGESVGGMYFNLVAAELLTMGGFFTVNALFEPPFIPHLTFWIVFNIVFIALFYRHARSLWIGTSYLTGGVYADPDDEREYQRPDNAHQP